MIDEHCGAICGCFQWKRIYFCGSVFSTPTASYIRPIYICMFIYYTNAYICQIYSTQHQPRQTAIVIQSSHHQAHICWCGSIFYLWMCASASQQTHIWYIYSTKWCLARKTIFYFPLFFIFSHIHMCISICEDECCMLVQSCTNLTLRCDWDVYIYNCTMWV